MQTWKLRSPAKLNLSLRVTGKRPDGYHALESLFAFCGWSDQLTLTQVSGENQISCAVAGPQAPIGLADHDNLAVKAYHFAVQKLGRLPAVHLELEKNIPAGAGLGGGSGNAAAVVRWAYTVCNKSIPFGDQAFVDQLRETLGADTYPILEGQARLWSGTGDQAGPALSLSQPLWILVVFPREFVSTAKIFAVLESYSSGLGCDSDLLDEALNGPNDLQQPACQVSKAVSKLLTDLSGACQNTGNVDDDALKVQMTGSGSACYALFQDNARAREAAQHPAIVQLPQYVGPLLTQAWVD